MDQTNNAAELRMRIVKYRSMARLTTDQETARRIHELADELEFRMRQIQAEDGQASSGPK